MKTVWVLTESHNDYNQHGEYFSAVWLEKPTREDLIKVGIREEGRIDLLLAGEKDGRMYNEDQWFDLEEVPLGKRCG